MSLFKSGNPTLSEKQFEKTIHVSTGDSMTVRGTMNKFGFLMLMVMAGAFLTWNQFDNDKNPMSWMIGGAIGGLIVSIVMIFKKEWSPFLAPAYAILEGLFLGGVSAFFSEGFYDGIVGHAILLTFAVVAAMYFLYSFRIIQVTNKLRSIIFIATASIAVFYLLTWVLGFFDIHFDFLSASNFSLFGIGFSIFVIVIAALNLLLDFDMIEQGVNMGAPKYMEWYGAFGLLVTIVWLYLEILRLLARLNSRD
jgi:uncharacterized YccA/Bax inhibitor family protein